ncbi:hypothetical protein HanXRQr2_Chr10g0430121 [Helianthus annuus]|uniref:Uncharacterized protein n=1 Tax=Helianthus annuus TaxID=4232 RepID=A0A9K3HW33_HELAN|nr:hypothetical protein HanXRQr2_Chr10g0430121 [Helianthus annuus]KAJ0513110.1 hypothetical protein HanHA300_Chr10g0353721 [Helianthus annuus]KAJ0529231.1 hypothetical protein HanHA89_Chr10g0375391 [Helianthus annuus]KAJ0696114.1 hypothetical protein HanLR1_Chr10g0353251 [Helianthus annuus]
MCELPTCHTILSSSGSAHQGQMTLKIQQKLMVMLSVSHLNIQTFILFLNNPTNWNLHRVFLVPPRLTVVVCLCLPLQRSVNYLMGSSFLCVCLINEQTRT